MLIGNCGLGTVAQRKSVSQIALTLVGAQALLRCLVVLAIEAIEDGNLQGSAPVPGDNICLIETAPQAPPPVHGNGRKEIRRGING